MILLALALIPAAWWLAGYMNRRRERADFDQYGIRYVPSWNFPRSEREAWERYELDDAMACERDERGETQYR